MAKITGVFEFQGKFGRAVGYKGSKGKMYVRQKADSILNPRTTKQMIQRMIMATVAVAIAFGKEVFNNSVEGKKAGAETLNYLRGQWMKMLRTADILTGNSANYRYIKKGDNFFAPNPYMISKGSLLAPSYHHTNGIMWFDEISVVGASTIASQLFPSVQVGDQITFVYLEYGEGANHTDIRTILHYCRIAFKTDSIPALVQETIDGETYFKFNPSAIDLNKAAGDWDKIKIQVRPEDTIPTQYFLPGKMSGHSDIPYAGVIISNEDNSTRSTSYLKLEEDFDGRQITSRIDLEAWRPELAYESFGNSIVDIDSESPVYLNNSTNVSVVEDVVTSNVPVLVQGESGDLLLYNPIGNPTAISLNIRGSEDEAITPNLVGMASGTVIFPGEDYESLNSLKMGNIRDSREDNETIIGLTSINNVGYVITGGSAVINGVTYTF